jgi:hypothetical protein
MDEVQNPLILSVIYHRQSGSDIEVPKIVQKAFRLNRNNHIYIYILATLSCMLEHVLVPELGKFIEARECML